MEVISSDIKKRKVSIVRLVALPPARLLHLEVAGHLDSPQTESSSISGISRLGTPGIMEPVMEAGTGGLGGEVRIGGGRLGKGEEEK